MTKISIVPGYGNCEDCGEHAELRPYGHGGASVCFDCAMKDEAEARLRFGSILKSASLVEIHADKSFGKKEE